MFNPHFTYSIFNRFTDKFSYIFFTKDSEGNTSNLKGYYAEAQFRNDKTTEVELFSVGSEIFESSK